MQRIVTTNWRTRPTKTQSATVPGACWTLGLWGKISQPLFTECWSFYFIFILLSERTGLIVRFHPDARVYQPVSLFGLTFSANFANHVRKGARAVRKTITLRVIRALLLDNTTGITLPVCLSPDRFQEGLHACSRELIVLLVHISGHAVIQRCPASF